MTDDKHFEIAKLGYRQAIIVALIGAVPAVIGTLAATGYFSDKQEPQIDTTLEDKYRDLSDVHAGLERAVVELRAKNDRLESQKTGYVETIETLESENTLLRRNLATSKRYPNVDGTWKNANGAIRTIDQYGITGECLMITEENLRYRGWFDDEETVRANPPTGERLVAKLTKAGTEIAWTNGKPWKR